MTSDEALERFGLPASTHHREEIRALLAGEIEKEEEDGRSGEEMLRTLCVQLCSIGMVEDALLIWRAKRSSFDAGCGLDVQFLCGAGLAITKDFLRTSSDPSARDALKYLMKCEEAGDFTDWTPEHTVLWHRAYYRLD